MSRSPILGDFQQAQILLPTNIYVTKENQQAFVGGIAATQFWGTATAEISQ